MAFAAIIVAFVGRLHPLGIVLASLLMSLLYLGGESVQLSLQLPSAVTGLFQGTLLFYLLAADLFDRIPAALQSARVAPSRCASLERRRLLERRALDRDLREHRHRGHAAHLCRAG